MLSLFAGRLDRKSYIVGNGLALGALIFAVLIVVVPVAILDLVINGPNSSQVFKVLYSIALIPAVMWYFFFMILMVRRLHDLGYPGLLIVILFTASEGAGRLLDIWILHLAGLVLIALLCTLPGQKSRNNFGNKPPKRFKMAMLIPNLN
jgi:uncharacterized membrane protein YhaH (DUF805 family)